jgi:hypothetical protein
MPNINGPEAGEMVTRAIARGQLALYDLIMQQHYEAEDCCNCESCMELGNQVFDWIIEADQAYRRNLYAHPENFDEEVEAELEILMRGWQARCQEVIQWAERHAARGFSVTHFTDFRRRCEEATAIVESFDEGESVMAEPLIVLRDQALLEHRNGETSEFIPS